MTTTLTRVLPLLTPRWLRLWARFAALHWRHVAARELGSRVGTDPRVRERGGRVGATLWLVTAYAEVQVCFTDGHRARYRVRWLDLRRPGEVSERWVWSETAAYAWVALAATSPVLAADVASPRLPEVQPMTDERMEWEPARITLDRPLGHGCFRDRHRHWYVAYERGGELAVLRARILPREPRVNGDEWVPTGRSLLDGMGRVHHGLDVQWSQEFVLDRLRDPRIVLRGDL